MQHREKQYNISFHFEVARATNRFLVCFFTTNMNNQTY